MNITPSAYDELLASLGNTIGMKLMFENDACNLLIDGKWSLNIIRITDESRIVLSCVVLETIPEEISYTTLLDILGYALNPIFGSGPTVGIDPESETMIACVSIHLSKMEAEEFPAIIAKFMEFVLDIFNRFNNDEAETELANEKSYTLPLNNNILIG